MFEKIMRSVGFMLLSNGLFFSEIFAYADSDSSGVGFDGVLTGLLGAIIGGCITAVVLVSKSYTKMKATKAEKYIKSKLQLHGQNDVYLRTDTTKTKINSK